jgi:hypothetical protein
MPTLHDPGRLPQSRLAVDRAALEAALYARGAVRRGRHLRVHCLWPEHLDTHPSCDVDVTVGVFLCRSCGRGGGVRQLLILLGFEDPPRPPRPPDPALPPGTAEVLAELRRQRARLAPFVWTNALADQVRLARQWAEAVRRRASTWGDTAEAWRVLALAAEVETFASNLEAGIDDELEQIHEELRHESSGRPR